VTETTTPKAAPPAPDAPTERLKALSDFLGRFAPAVGERRDGCGTHLADDDRPNRAVIVARDDAMVACFEAVERIARL
jgi:hypothetical protein